MDKDREIEKLKARIDSLAEELLMAYEELNFFYDISSSMCSPLDSEKTMELILSKAVEIIEADKAAIMVFDESDNKLKLRKGLVSGNWMGDIPALEVNIEGTILSRAIHASKGIIANDITEGQNGISPLIATKSLLGVSLYTEDKVIGLFTLGDKRDREFTSKDLKLAASIGSQISGAIANARLFIEQKQAEKEKTALEEQLRQSQKMEAIGQLAGGVAHDFNNLLTVIRGYSQLSLIDLKTESPLKRNIEEIEKASQRAAGLTGQLLAFSRRQVMELKVTDLRTVLQNMENMLRRMIGEDIELITELPDDLGKVKVDPGQIEQVILNLAVNAKDAMPEGGNLRIEVTNAELDKEFARRHIGFKAGQYVMLSVTDTGCGMAAEVRERIFEPFFTTKEKGKGTGLGLSTVYGIVKQTGGNISVYSELGRGTTFKIYLPRVDEPVDVLSQSVTKGESPCGNETILVVEDEEEVRKLVVHILEKQGYKVLEASHGRDASILCSQHVETIHLMLTDVVLPLMSGPKLTETLLSIHPEMRVLYMSGYIGNSIGHHGLLEEGRHYIQKPFTVDRLLGKVREVLDQRIRT